MKIIEQRCKWSTYVLPYWKQPEQEVKLAVDEHIWALGGWDTCSLMSALLPSKCTILRLFWIKTSNNIQMSICIIQSCLCSGTRQSRSSSALPNTHSYTHTHTHSYTHSYTHTHTHTHTHTLTHTHICSPLIDWNFLILSCFTFCLYIFSLYHNI